MFYNPSNRIALNTKNLANDFSASIVVFLVALPLCLGVAQASSASALTGLIAGIVGGIVIGWLSGSSLSVSGPAAGLTAIVAGAIGKLGFETFLLSVIIAGILQIILGYLKAGFVGDFIPNAVIKAMLAAIGIILILKQIPHFLGYDFIPDGVMEFEQADKKNTFTEIIAAVNDMHLFAFIIAFSCLLILIVFESEFIKNNRWLKLFPAPLLVVITGIALHLNAEKIGFTPLQPEHLVQMPLFENIHELWKGLSVPKWSGLLEPSMYVAAFTLAIVASLESLLSIEAVDKLDPEKRISPTNRELKAQGVGNMLSGLLGGLPVTSVIVRSSANVNAGGKSKASAILHGIWLLLSLLFLTQFINLIPKASLAAILIYTGYKLSSIKIIREYYAKGSDQFVPFSITIISILFTDLLTGIVIGILVGLFFVVKSNFKSAILVMKDDMRYLIRFKREVSFLNKSFIRKTFEKIPDDTAVLIDPTRANFIDKDVIDIVNDFIVNASTRGIRVYIKRNPGDKEIFIDPQKREII